jgi:peptidoglycan/xylan/chitin deacetylase (PgdA/CDA1 family)
VSERVHGLIYHDVVTASRQNACGIPGRVAAAYKLEPDRFLSHLRALAETGVRFGLSDGRAPALLSFDDGGASAPWIATELERHGWRGAFFVITSRIGTPGFADATELRELLARGHEIGSHSHSHPPYMGKLGGAAVAREWQTSYAVLAEILGSPPASAAVPGGSVSAAVIEQAAAAGYRHLYTSTPTTRVRRHGEMRVVGRYTIWAGDSASLAAALVVGARLPRARRWVSWQSKSAAKRVSPGLYEAARSLRGTLADSRRNDASRST